MITIDLRTDAADVQRLLGDAVRDYLLKHQAASTAKTHPPVSRIDLAFSLGDGESAPWVHLHLDTKPGGEPDGDPTHPDYATLPREAWLPAVEAVCRGGAVRVLTPDGGSRECDDTSLADALGNFLVAALTEARGRGVFAALPRTPRCELGVEDPTTGDFGWPSYEDRGKENLVG